MRFLCSLLSILVTISAGSSCTPLSYPPSKDLLIAVSDFPAGWVISDAGPRPLSSAPLGGSRYIESIEITFYASGGSANEVIKRYKSVSIAKNEFTAEDRLVFRATRFNTPWITPSQLACDDLEADQTHNACSQEEWSPWPNCAYVAQYGVYVVRFTTPMIPDRMTYRDLENITRAIDARMAPYIANQ